MRKMQKKYANVKFVMIVKRVGRLKIFCHWNMIWILPNLDVDLVKLLEIYKNFKIKFKMIRKTLKEFYML